MSKPTAWSGKKYGENRARVRCPDEPCALCGKGVTPPPAGVMRAMVRVNARTHEFIEKDADIPEPDDQGCFPVGPDCARRLRKAGVPVFELVSL